MDKTAMMIKGRDLMQAFCSINDIPAPKVKVHPSSNWPFGVCAYYRADVINICLEKCAHIGKAGRQWSYPGYVIDRTPYGVIQHELGHHVDVYFGISPSAYWSDYSAALRKETGEAKLTNYCPNDAEWFAEIFRLFVTNPELLMRLGPLTFARLRADGRIPVFTDCWQDRLRGAPERTIQMAAKKIEAIPQAGLWEAGA